MNEKQRTILALAAVALLLALVFFVPWRLHASGDITWAPLYRPPVAYTPSYEQSLPGARYSYAEAEIALEAYLLELLAIALAGGVAYWLSTGSAKVPGAEAGGERAM